MRLRWMSPSDNLGIRFLSPPDGTVPVALANGFRTKTQLQENDRPREGA
jgi:hypothetical protein